MALCFCYVRASVLLRSGLFCVVYLARLATVTGLWPPVTISGNPVWGL